MSQFLHPLFNNLRVGHRYRVINNGEQFEFQVIRRINDHNYVVKDMHTLELYDVEDIVRYGIAKDFDFMEI